MEGKDRTGAVVADYRMEVLHWSLLAASEEVWAYNLSPFGEIFPAVNKILKQIGGTNEA